MKKILIVIFNILFLLSHANAETFIIALKKAYTNNSELNAERENIYISEEELKISRGSYLPTITLEGTKSEEDTNKLTNQSGGNATITDADPLTKSISISQTIFDFGRGAELSKSKIGINLAKANLYKPQLFYIKYLVLFLKVLLLLNLNQFYFLITLHHVQNQSMFVKWR